MIDKAYSDVATGCSKLEIVGARPTGLTGKRMLFQNLSCQYTNAVHFRWFLHLGDCGHFWNFCYAFLWAFVRTSRAAERRILCMPGIMLTLCVKPQAIYKGWLRAISTLYDSSIAFSLPHPSLRVGKTLWECWLVETSPYLFHEWAKLDRDLVSIAISKSFCLCS